MKIIAHQGYWKKDGEKNRERAFRRSFELGFGAELDIRDLAGELVVSHDLPSGRELRLRDFLRIYKGLGAGLPLALNIKSNGLSPHLKRLLKTYRVTHYFVFDMSVPDTRHYLKEGFRIFTRQSEIEKIPPFYNQAAGVWVDCFYGDWADAKLVGRHIKAGKEVCLVSPELHGRNHQPFWKKIRRSSITGSGNLMICTDYPERAREFFND